MKLRHISGDQAGVLVDIKPGGMTIGRGEECDLPIDTDGVSREHARIRCLEQGFVLEDLGSTNGTRVNGQQISQPRALMNGDRIGLGEHILLFTDERDLMDEDAVHLMKAERQRQLQARSSGRRRMVAGALGVVVLLAAVAFLVANPFREKQQPAPPQVSVPPPEPAVIKDGPELVAPAANTPAPQEPPAPQPPPQPPPIEPDPLPPPDPPVLRRLTYIYVDSQPPGAAITLNGRPAGTSPALLKGVAKGMHDLGLRLDGYKDRTVAVSVPAPKSPAPFKLQPRDRTCLVTSDPAGALVFFAGQCLGRTPYLVRDLDPGIYELGISLVGYVGQTRAIEIKDYTATIEQVILRKATGAVRVVTLPAGAAVRVDGSAKGTTSTGVAEDTESSPLLVAGLTRGKHKFRATFKGIESEIVVVMVESGRQSAANLTVWIPNTVLEINGGRKMTGMIRRRTAAGDLVFAITPQRDLKIPANKISAAHTAPLDEAIDKLRAKDEPAPDRPRR